MDHSTLEGQQSKVQIIINVSRSIVHSLYQDSIAGTYREHLIEPDDLVAFGIVGGLAKAHEFDPSKDAKFSTFVYFPIHNAVMKGLKDSLCTSDPLTTPPRSTHRLNQLFEDYFRPWLTNIAESSRRYSNAFNHYMITKLLDCLSELPAITLTIFVMNRFCRIPYRKLAIMYDLSSHDVYKTNMDVIEILKSYISHIDDDLN